MSIHDLNEKAQALLKEANELKSRVVRESNQKKTEQLQQRMLKRSANRQEATKDADALWHGRYSESGQLVQPGLEQKAQEKIDEGLRGYENFVASMSQVVGVCMHINKAIAASDPLGAIANKLVDVADQGQTMLKKPAAVKALNQIKEPEKRNEMNEYVTGMEKYLQEIKDTAKKHGLGHVATPKPGM